MNCYSLVHLLGYTNYYCDNLPLFTATINHNYIRIQCYLLLLLVIAITEAVAAMFEESAMEIEMQEYEDLFRMRDDEGDRAEHDCDHS